VVCERRSGVTGRPAARGGNGDDIAALAVWAVPAGLVGARLYHVK
jgi:prolipoprotein diacylglyceryltransferase